jgi:hypothetical protein
MVDLGQKGWKQFHLFYWNKVKEIKNHRCQVFESGGFYALSTL